jgi:hypothetical protein
VTGKVSILCFSILISSTPLWGETFQWVDDSGVTHFSDNASLIPRKHRNNATKIEDSHFDTYVPPKTADKHFKALHEFKRADDTVTSEPEKFKMGSAEFVVLERQLVDIWNRMRHELKAKKIEAALAYFTESSRDSFRSQFTALRHQLPKIAGEMGETRLVKVSDDVFAECDLRREENGTTYSYMLQFVRDYDGVWRIRTF